MASQIPNLLASSDMVLASNDCIWKTYTAGDDLGDITEIMNNGFQGRPAANKNTVE